ncbi:ricin B lectin domain-containing protein [Mycena epipterygia]|nr:ricin B lectin domain-containing protein [Mycena epipterygia]
MPIFQGVYTITGFQSKSRVDLDGGTKVQGWGPLQPDVPEYPNQLWNVEPTDRPGFDSYTICNVKSGTYLEIQDGNGTDGTPVTCSEAATGGKTATYQEWEFIKITDGYYKVCNVATQNYLDIDKGSPENGTKIQGWWGGLDGNENQLWAFSPNAIDLSLLVLYQIKKKKQYHYSDLHTLQARSWSLRAWLNVLNVPVDLRIEGDPGER